MRKEKRKEKNWRTYILEMRCHNKQNGWLNFAMCHSQGKENDTTKKSEK